MRLLGGPEDKADLVLAKELAAPITKLKGAQSRLESVPRFRIETFWFTKLLWHQTM